MTIDDIKRITDRVVEDNQYLTTKEAEVLFNETSTEGLDIIRVAADTLRQRLNGDLVSYIVNLNVNFTNICDCRCLFCGFRRNSTDPDAYTITIDDLDAKLSMATSKGALEICFQGGLYPELVIGGLKAKNLLDTYAKLLAWVKEHYPQVITHAYSPEEIFFLHEVSGKSTHYILECLKDHGLDTMPGTAAEILVDDVRKRICPKKLNTSQWVNVVKQAHSLQIPTTCTILYGTVETNKDIAKHLNVLRTLQQETNGFTEFIPLALVADKTPIAHKIKPLTSIDRLKMLAISRLFFADLIPNIQASWVKQGIPETKESLNWGVNDIGGTLFDEQITFKAGGAFGQAMTEEELIHIITSSNKKPVLRNTIYKHLSAPQVCSSHS